MAEQATSTSDEKRSEALSSVLRGLTSTTDPEVFAAMERIAVMVSILAALLVEKGIITMDEFTKLDARVTSTRDQEKAKARDESIEALGPLWAGLFGLKP